MDTAALDVTGRFRLPRPNFDPPFNITRASHVVLTSHDLAASRSFYTEVIGLIVSDEDADMIWLRGVEERAHHSLTLKRTSDAPACECLGFRVFTEDDLDRAWHHLTQLAFPAAWVEVPHQGRTLRFRDPTGVVIELCATMTPRPRMHTKIHLHRGAAAMRMDHFQVLVPDVLGSAAFYAALGFRVSDFITAGDTDQVVGVFLHRKDNPWDIVFLNRPGPRFHHGGYVVESTAAIFKACDVAGNLGMAGLIEHGPGRHGHSHSYYCYLRDPDGHRTELLLPAIQLIDIDDEPEKFVVRPGVNSNLWGIPAPKTWIEQATAFRAHSQPV